MVFGLTLMEDPVVASDGHTYNRADIENWLKTHDTSPQTSEPVEDKVLRPNIAMRKQIIAWREKHGLPVPSFAAPAKAPAARGGGAEGWSGQLAEPLMVFCMTCDKAISVSCAIDLARCKLHDTRHIAAIVSSVRHAHTEWLQLHKGRPEQLQADTERIDAAAAAAMTEIQAEVAELKLELHRMCVGDLECTLQEQAQLLADVQIAAASPHAAVAGSDACRCLRTAVALRPVEDAGGGRFEAVAGNGGDAGAAAARSRRLGRIVCGGPSGASATSSFRLGFAGSNAATSFYGSSNPFLPTFGCGSNPAPSFGAGGIAALSFGDSSTPSFGGGVQSVSAGSNPAQLLGGSRISAADAGFGFGGAITTQQHQPPQEAEEDGPQQFTLKTPLKCALPVQIMIIFSFLNFCRGKRSSSAAVPFGGAASPSSGGAVSGYAFPPIAGGSPRIASPIAAANSADSNRVCFRCGRNSHFANECFARTHVRGYDLENPGGGGGNVCFRCGRNSHFANECYARTHVRGYDLF
jgi:hypothetical protein